MTCLHENVGLSDEHSILLCWDCGREFAQLAYDGTLVVPMETQRVLLIPGGDDLSVTEHIAFAVVPHNDDGVLTVKTDPVYPCAKCGYEGRCPDEEGEECHT